MGHPISLINPDLFWAKVEMAPGGCWKWTGRLDRDGYGKYQVKNGGVQHYFIAHRAAYELALSTIPEGLVIDHLCRNRSCCNPAHLEAVTADENRRRGAGLGNLLWGPTDRCGKGHIYDAATTLWTTRRNRSGELTRFRYCGACANERQRRRLERRRAA